MDNADVVRKVEDAYNANDLDVLDQYFTTDFQAHTPGSDLLPPGLEGGKTAHRASMHSFPDRRSTIEDLVGEGDRVVARIRMTGRNTGGLPQFGIPANDKPVDIQWIQISRHAQDGRIAETWAQLEVPRLMQQLGAMPMPEM
jgi:predicted ester cyclase